MFLNNNRNNVQCPKCSHVFPSNVQFGEGVQISGNAVQVGNTCPKCGYYFENIMR